MHGFVEQGLDVRPVVGGGVRGIHLGGDLFAHLAAGFAANHIDRGAARDLIQPRCQNRIRLQPGGAAREIDEDRLGDLFGELGRADLAQGGGIDQAEMALDEFGEGILGVLLSVARQQFQIGAAHVCKHIGADPRNPPRKFQTSGARACDRQHCVHLNLLHARSRVSPLSALRGEGVAAHSLGSSTGRAAFGHRAETNSPNAGNEVRYFRITRRAPSPLKGERAGVRGEAVRLA